MNKKFLSAILFGALMVTSTGTFVSCKDYDDDIENLQGQIDKLATKDELSSQIASLQAALSTAQSEAASAKSEATKALAAAQGAEAEAAQAALDAANAKLEAIEAAQAEVAKVKEELDAAVNAKFETEQAKLTAALAELTTKVEKMTGLTTEMITSIDWQPGFDGTYGYFQESSSDYGRFYWELTYAQMPKAWDKNGNPDDNGTEKSITFGKDMVGEITFNANETFAATRYALISVSPANAVLTDDMLSLINSKGENLNDYVDLKVEPYKGLLTRSAANTGLFLVSVSLDKNVTWDKLDKVGYYKGDNYSNYVRYALAAEKEGRVVTSGYDISLYANPETEGICNLPFASTIKSSIKEKSSLYNYGEWQQQGSATGNGEWCYPVVEGEEFTITSGSDCGEVLASYVTVDIDNKNLSTTDKAAIKNLTIDGVKKVSQTGVHGITISGTYAVGVVVPLKLTAIGYDGRQHTALVWVKAGNSSEIAQTAAYVVTPDKFVANPTNYAYSGKQAFTVPAGATKMEVSIYAKNEISLRFSQTGSVLGNSTLTFLKADGKTVATAIKDVAIAQLNANLNLQTMVDDKVYEGTVKFYNDENTFLSQSTITIQKVLPKTAPAGFSVKTNQKDANGVYNCYLVPNSWAANTATEGTMDMDHVFNWGKGEAKDYVITFAEAKYDAANKKDVNNVVTGADDLVIKSDLEFEYGYIDNKTAHATTVVYNYGNISTALYNKDKNTWTPYTIEVESFNTVFNCIYNSTYAWRWATHEDLGHKKDANGVWSGVTMDTDLTYGREKTAPTGLIVSDLIFGDSSRDNMYDKTLNPSYNNSLVITKAHVVSNGNKEVDEYFKVEFEGTKITKFNPTQVSTETNPTGKVASTLVIVVEDMYGCERTIELPMTVNPR